MQSVAWAEWSTAEILSMHGVEEDAHSEIDYDCIDCEDENKEDKDCCPRCSGWGCNYCLML